MKLPSAIMDDILGLARETVFRFRVFSCTVFGKHKKVIGELNVKGSCFDTVLELKTLLLENEEFQRMVVAADRQDITGGRQVITEKNIVFTTADDINWGSWGIVKEDNAKTVAECHTPPTSIINVSITDLHRN